MDSKKIIESITYMIENHGLSFRKGSHIPYLTHPLGVMNILLEEQAFDSTITDDLILAGLFHDLEEDTIVSISDIKERFGEKVAELVQSDSEPEELKKHHDQKGTWKERKEYTLGIVRSGNRFTKMLFCADKLDNARAINRDLIMGIDVWKRFNAGYEDIIWYYESAIINLKSENSIEKTRMCKLLEIEVKNMVENENKRKMRL